MEAISKVNRIKPLHDQNRPAHKMKRIVEMFVKYDETETYLGYLSLGEVQSKVFNSFLQVYYREMEQILRMPVVTQQEYDIINQAQQLIRPVPDCNFGSAFHFQGQGQSVRR